MTNEEKSQEERFGNVTVHLNMSIDGLTLIRIAKCIKLLEPEIWNSMKDELEERLTNAKFKQIK